MKTNSALMRALQTLCLLFLLCSCVDSTSMQGEIASVNGQGIFLREVEFRRIRLFGGPSSLTGVGQETLRQQYSYVVRQMIEELVICQYMESRKIPFDPKLLQEEEQRIIDDYPRGGFEEMLLEQGISLEIWRENLRRQFMVRQFISQVIRPEIPLNPSQVQDYYSTHASEFVIPEQWHFIQITGLDKKEVEKARDDLLRTRNATAVQKAFLVTMHDIRMGAERLPEPVLKEVSALTPWKASSVKGHENEFRCFVLLEKISPGVLDVASTYARVEQALLEDKIQVAYSAWLKKNVPKAKIRIAGLLMADVVLPSAGDAGAPQSNGTRTGSAPPPAPAQNVITPAKAAVDPT